MGMESATIDMLRHGLGESDNTVHRAISSVGFVTTDEVNEAPGTD